MIRNGKLSGDCKIKKIIGKKEKSTPNQPSCPLLIPCSYNELKQHCAQPKNQQNVSIKMEQIKPYLILRLFNKTSYLMQKYLIQ